MFRITDNAITPRRASFERALYRLPVAHRRAQMTALTHLHGAMAQAAEKAGHEPGAVVLSEHKGSPFVGIAHTPDGDRLADFEYGTPESAPSPVLRAAATTTRPGAQVIYDSVLRRELGI
jgi:hypothetical protein